MSAAGSKNGSKYTVAPVGRAAAGAGRSLRNCPLLVTPSLDFSARVVSRRSVRPDPLGPRFGALGLPMILPENQAELISVLPTFRLQ